MIKSFDLNFQIIQIQDEFNKKINKILNEMNFIGGEEVTSFENNFASYTGATHCVSVANGTDALEIILEALNLEKSEIIIPAFTFVATAESVIRIGATPIFVDIDESYTIDVEKIKKVITPKTRAIVTVNLHGNPSNLVALEKLAKEYDLFLIQDSAQAHGTVPQINKLADYGVASAYSFYPGKTLGAFGDGGAIVTKNIDFAENLRRISNHGRLKKFDHEIIGRNSRLDTIQAAVLNLKLELLDKWIARRIQIAQLYDEAFSSMDFITRPDSNRYGTSSYHQYVIVSDFTKEIEQALRQNNVEFGYHYPYIVPELPPYVQFAKNDYENSVRVSKKGISLPIGEHLTDNNISMIIEVIYEATKSK